METVRSRYCYSNCLPIFSSAVLPFVENHRRKWHGNIFQRAQRAEDSFSLTRLHVIYPWIDTAQYECVSRAKVNGAQWWRAITFVGEDLAQEVSRPEHSG